MKKITARIFGLVLLIFGINFAGFLLPSTSINPFSTPAYAVPNTPGNTPAQDTPASSDDTPTEGNITADDTANNPENTSENTSDTSDNEENASTTEENSEETPEEDPEALAEKAANVCADQTGGLSWIVCPSSGLTANIIDSLYNAISDLLEVQPLSMESNSPIYLVWQYARNITNIVFIIFLCVVIYSQLTGLGINNYGIKRILPRLIIAVLLVNLSFIICSLAVDVSNITGASLRGTFTNIENQVILNSTAGPALQNFSVADLLATVISGGTIAGVAIGVLGGANYIFFMLLVVLIGALLAVISGLVTLAARQALVALLIMISPLAFVAYLLPNTEKFFTKWRDLLLRMLVFYPLFSFLFGASELLGYAILASATSAMGLILGVAIQIFPLIAGWSLMKFSGTVLSAVNSGVRKATAPIGRGLGGWSLSKAEQGRQRYLANSTASSAKLRRYLDYRRELRALDTKNSTDIRSGKALERVYRTVSSSTGRGANGSSTYSSRPNRYTVNAKRAKLAQTRHSTAAAALDNTLSGYGTNFKDAESQRLSQAHFEAYKDNMAQSFLTVNQAQADQEALLGEYLKASTEKNQNPYEFNRLVVDASGDLGHLGEASIMGQVIVGNANIEARRRSEAKIIATKFGVPKPEFRGMIMDRAYMSDNGVATDANGLEIEDDQYRPRFNEAAGRPYEITPWQKYIAVHKTTRAEITKAEYDALSPAAQADYRKVRYIDITDDDGKPVQRVYEDDAGYMKELLVDDIAIGDPINMRYMASIGVANAPGEKTGILRRYHSTIKGALDATGYKDHMAEATPMLTSQIDSGYITTPGQLNIGRLQSLNVASKAGPFLINDRFFIENWQAIIETMTISPKNFEHYFSDDDIMNYRNVNGEHLKGLKRKEDENHNLLDAWEKLDHAQMAQLPPEKQLEYRKNFLKHDIFPKAVTKMLGNLNRSLTPNILEKQKPDTLRALDKLTDSLLYAASMNQDSAIDFASRLDPNTDFFDSPDPNIIKAKISAAIRAHHGYTGSDDDSTPPPSGSDGGGNGGGGNGGGGSTPPPAGSPAPSGSGSYTRTGKRSASGRSGVETTMKRMERQRELQNQYDYRNNPLTMAETIQGYVMCSSTYDTFVSQVMAYTDVPETLREHQTEIQQILDDYRPDTNYNSTADAINSFTHNPEIERRAIQEAGAAITDFIMTLS